ncbi:uncharacterized protein LOC121639351 [Melanotaenia boesemani]|uniref:uncharacterized protein LOC121639351 n=1 Tax=Melanotaenia boesemani TaxID=1250792 RepID=UPI001C03E966|nr:uncharacterized protein LOC121639351 [Melanotaenia boesemani]
MARSSKENNTNTTFTYTWSMRIDLLLSNENRYNCQRAAEVKKFDVPKCLSASGFQDFLKSIFPRLSRRAFELCRVNRHKVVIPLTESTPLEMRSSGVLGCSALYIRPECDLDSDITEMGEVMELELANNPILIIDEEEDVAMERTPESQMTASPTIETKSLFESPFLLSGGESGPSKLHGFLGLIGGRNRLVVEGLTPRFRLAFWVGASSLCPPFLKPEIDAC